MPAALSPCNPNSSDGPRGRPPCDAAAAAQIRASQRSAPPAWELPELTRLLITIGLVFVIIGLLWPWITKLGLGHLPGDIVIERENIRIYIPIVTMLVVSVVVSLVLWLIGR